MAEHPIGAAGPALLLLGIALLACTAFMAYEWRNLPQGAGAAMMSQMFVLGMCITTGLGLFLLLRWQRGRGAYVNLHEGGLQHRFAGKTWTLPWDALDRVTVERRQARIDGGALPVRIFITVLTQAGARLKFNNYQRLDALGDTLSLRLTEHLLPGTLADLRAGKTVDFGVFKVNSKGLEAARVSARDWHFFVGRKFLPWQDLASFQFDNGSLVLTDRSGRAWARAFHFHVKNILLLLEVMRGVQERKAAKA